MKNNLVAKAIFCIIIILILFTTIGYSVLDEKLTLTGDITYRVKADIRITDLKLNNVNEALEVYSAQFSKNQNIIGVNLTNTDSSITYKVEVTNFSNEKMGILQITGLPSNLTYELKEYSMGEALCGSDGNCLSGAVKTFYITIKYKDNNSFDSSNTLYNLKLYYDFRGYYKVSYACINDSDSFPTEVMDGATLNVNIGNKPLDFLVKMGSTINTNRTFSGGILSIPNITGDLFITGFPGYTDSSGANNPALASGMISVVYCDICKKWVKADITKSHNYGQQIWANAVTVVSSKRSTYQNAPNGTEIPMDDINGMYVWIPRYEYMYTNMGTSYAGGSKATPGGISIKFLSNTNNSTTTNYKLMPGFTFGTKALSGLWIGKFELGGTLSSACKNTACNVSSLVVKPSVKALTNKTLGCYFYAIRSMQTNNSSTFGFSTSTMDVHMIKMTEWATASYLTQSVYGKYGNSNYTGANKEVYVNKSSTYITGSSNQMPSGSTTKTQVAYDVVGTGTGASTTGTIYGIYDMSGGCSEYAMANYRSTLSSSGLGSFPDAKYYDTFTGSSSTMADKACNGNICYGYGWSETTNWYNDAHTALYSSWAWPVLGGYYDSSNNNAYAGVFSVGRQDGTALAHSSTRVVIVP